MKYPWSVEISPLPYGGFLICLWEPLTQPGDVYRAENAEELLEFLKGVYEEERDDRSST